jgi:predicted dehydrogenase
MGFSNLKAVQSQNIVGLCDVDWKYSEPVFQFFPKAKRYYDFRKMYDEIGKEIDAVIVATADHTHAIIASTAMTMDKHVYVQKPLTHSVYESRLLTRLADKHRVATQMGNQGASGEGIRQICAWIWAGEIGEVRKVECYTNRPIWPQGLNRPEKTEKPYKELNWDLFIGPAPMRPYNPIYTPWNWRGWWDFGTGALGDMACHIMDPAFFALDLKYPEKISGSSTLVNVDSPPHAEIVEYTFPARPKKGKIAMPKVKVKWYDGGLLPQRPAELKDGEMMGDENGGIIFVGTKGKIMTGCYGMNPTLLPTSKMKDFNRPEKTLPRVKGGDGNIWDTNAHEQDWIRACKESPENRTEASSHFGFSGPFNETVVMGVLAVRLQGLQRELQWDGENMRFTNISPSDKLKIVTVDNFNVVSGNPTFDRQFAEFNAAEMAAEWVKHTYQNGFTLPPMPA